VGRVRYLPEAAVRAMHGALIAEHGGASGVRDDGLLASALARPKNRKLYSRPASLFDLAAAYAFGIVRNHPFVDGNKRVALMAAYVFLEMNGQLLDAPEVEAASVIARIAAGKAEERELSTWLRENCRPIGGHL